MDRTLHHIIFLLLSSLLSGCNNAHLDNVDRLGGFNYEAGLPELRLVATGYINEQDETYISVSGDIVYASLIYISSSESDQYEANLSLEIQIQESSKAVVDTVLNKTLAFADNSIIYNQDVYNFQENFQVPPGDYKVNVTLTDQQSRKKAILTSETSIPDPNAEKAHITEIRILAKDSEKSDETEFTPITTYDIPGRYDSLQFHFQVTNNDLNNPLEIETRLLKFRADNSIAEPVFHLSPTNSSIAFKGIDYDEYEELLNSKRELQQQGSVMLEYAYTDLEPGNYRLEVSTSQKRNHIYKGIDFSVKSESYPSLKTPLELARPLRYLMDEKEYHHLMKIKDPDSLKIAVEHFWLSNIKNSVIARQVLSLYYERVEEANKQFSNFKEGWKTDPGMVYILFGPPWYLEVQMTFMEWAYSYNPYETEKRLFFEQNKLNTKYFPFNHYILERSQKYHTLHYQQIQDWRSGRILNRNL